MQTISSQEPFPQVFLQIGVGPGHGSNSQFGPVLPTEEPSGQSLASRVQGIGFGSGVGAGEGSSQKHPVSVSMTTEQNTIVIFFVVFIGEMVKKWSR